MKIAIIGYGQMGKLIDELAEVHLCDVVARIDPILNTDLDSPEIDKADVCIDFTDPHVAYQNIQKLAERKKQIVIGTTGWFDKLPEVNELVAKFQIGLLYGANFSIGMNLFMQMIEYSAELLNKTDYEPFGLEMHHKKKQDSPSGTAKVLAQILLDKLDKKEVAQYDKLDRKIADNEVHFASIRAGSIPGKHIVGFDSEADTIELKHSARNRKGLALGAIKAAKWLQDKKGIYKFSDVFHQILAGE